MTPKNTPATDTETVTLGEAAAQYIISIPQDKKPKAQQEIFKFIRWYGEGRLCNALTVPEVSSYAEQITSSATELPEKLEPVKDFLAFSHKQGWTTLKLASQIKIMKRTSNKSSSNSKRQQDRVVTLSAKGYADLEAEIASLNNERPAIVEEIQKARADKDFKENAPLDAAREQLSKLESRIKDLEATLKVATIIDNKTMGQETARQVISIGNTVVLKDLSTRESIEYKLVDAREANPVKGRISVASPIGKALLNHKKGDHIEVKAPAGNLPYIIEEIKQG